jgi:phosphatidate phosphatase PAH1
MKYKIMKKIVVVDIDGTVSKVGERLKYLKSKKPNWDNLYKK